MGRRKEWRETLFPFHHPLLPPRPLREDDWGRVSEGPTLKLVGHLLMELSSLISLFLKTDLVSLDPSSPERPAKQSPQNLKKRSFV